MRWLHLVYVPLSIFNFASNTTCLYSAKAWLALIAGSPRGSTSQNWSIPVGRWIRAVLTALVIAALPSALATGQTQPVQSSSSPGCQFLSAPGAVPAFCDTFDQPAGTGNRSGDLNGTVWGVSRLLGGVNSGQGQYYDASPTIMQKCVLSVPVQPPNDVAICNGQLVEAQ